MPSTLKRTQTQKQRLQSATVALTAPYRMGGYRRPVYRQDTRFGITETGRAVAQCLHITDFKK